MNDYICEITLDLNCKETPCVISAGQYDVNRKIIINVTANGNSYSVAGCTAVCKGVSGNGENHFAINCTVDNKNNKIVLNTDETMFLTQGNAVARIVLSDGTRVYSTQKFIVFVGSAFEGNITQTNSYSILNNLINRVIQITETGGIIVDEALNPDSKNPLSNSALTRLIKEIQDKKSEKSFFSKYSFLYDTQGNIFSYTLGETITSSSFSHPEYTDDKKYWVWLSNDVTKVEDGALPNPHNIAGIRCENTADKITIPQTYSGCYIVYGYSSLSMFYILASISKMFHGKADKSTTLAGYGINDAYTKTEINSLIEGAGGAVLQGEDGKSAYQIACDNGFSGTEAEWLDSLNGSDGVNGTDGKDYVLTNDDKIEIAQQVLSALPNGDEVGY